MRLKVEPLFSIRILVTLPNFYPVGARVWQLLASYADKATGQGAGPLASAPPWPLGGKQVAA